MQRACGVSREEVLKVTGSKAVSMQQLAASARVKLKLRENPSSIGPSAAATPLSRGVFFYLRTPDARTIGVGTGIGAKVGLLGRAAAGPVFLHVGTTFVEPTVVGYEPTEGSTTDPYPSVPGICASASVLVRVNAVASAIVVTFMIVSFILR